MLKTYKPLVDAFMETYECDAEEAAWRIEQASQQERLKTYLEWNGILGYTGVILTIVNGKAN